MSNSAAVRTEAMEVPQRASTVSFALDDTHIMADVCGAMDRNLDYIERRMSVSIRCRGNDIQINGDLAEDAQEVMRQLYRHLQCSDEPITNGLIDAKIRDAAQLDLPAIPAPSNVVPQVSIRTRRKTITPRTQTQTQYISAMQRGEDLVFGLGPAGTGKTYLAVAQAVSQLIQGKVQRLIFSRPAVEAGEKLGFLPGDMKDKVDPYLRPIYDALYDCLPPEQVETRLASGEIEVAPLAFMRGRTLADAFIILDEAQNTTKEQMKMFLTRFGENSQMIICGDPRQTDIPGGPPMSGLTDAMSKLKDVDGISFIEFSAQDVVRHPIVGKIVHAYEGDSE